MDGVGTPLLATSTSGLPVTYSVSGPCQVLDLGGGKFSTQPKYPIAGTADTWTCTFTASQAGNAKFAAAAPVSQILTFNRSRVSVNLTRPNSIPASGVFVYASYFAAEGRDQTIRRTEGITFSSSSSEVCSIGEQTNEEGLAKGLRVTVRAKSNGNCILRADFAGNATYKPSNAIWSIMISGLNAPVAGASATQTINFPALSNQEVGPAQALRATASSGLPITYTSLTPSVCYIIAGASTASVQTVANRPVGTSWDCTVRASQPGDNRFAAAAPVDQSFKWTQAAMLITVTGSSTLVGRGTHTITASLNFADINKRGTSGLGHLLKATSLTPATCSVISNAAWSRSGGIVTRTSLRGIANGECQLQYEFAGTPDRMPTSVIWKTMMTRLP